MTILQKIKSYFVRKVEFSKVNSIEYGPYVSIPYCLKCNYYTPPRTVGGGDMPTFYNQVSIELNELSICPKCGENLFSIVGRYIWKNDKYLNGFLVKDN